MSKKLLVVVLALALFFGVAPANKVSALTAEELTAEAVQEYIPDPVFAKAIAEQIAADETFDLSAYTSVKDVLLSYPNTITYTNTEEMIKSIVGINYLQNATVVLTAQDIKDLSPLNDGDMITNEDGRRGNPVQITRTPTNVWPSNLINLQNGTYSIPNPLFAAGKVVFVYGEEAKNVEVIYDIYEESTSNPSTINVDLGVSEYGGTAAPSKPAPEANDVSAVFGFKPVKTETAEATILTRMYNYFSNKAPQQLSVVYYYELESEIVYPVLLEVEAETTIGAYLVKYSTDDLVDGVPVEGATPLAGAVYELYKVGADGEEDSLIGEYTTKSEKIAVTGLEPGKYYFVEKQAPKGYKLDTTPLYFEHDGQNAVSFNFNGLAQSAEVTKNNAKYYPNWEPGIGYDEATALDLETKDVETVNAGGYSSELKDCVGFIRNGEEVTINISEKTNASAEMEGSYKWYVNGEEVADPAKAIADLAKSGKIDGPINVKAVQSYELAEDAMETLVGKDVPITIWVENSTENDEGGTVNVEGCKEDEISSSGVYENTPREINNVVEGQAYKEDNWYVVVDEIKVGPMGEDGVSGAVYTVVEQPQDEEGNYVITLEDGSEIKVKIDYDQENEHVVVTIVDMDRNIDVAIPFARHEQEPVPVTGDNTKTAILVASMLASTSLIGYVFFAKRKEEE